MQVGGRITSAYLDVHALVDRITRMNFVVAEVGSSLAGGLVLSLRSVLTGGLVSSLRWVLDEGLVSSLR